MHPTQKPTALAIKASVNAAKAGETVLDLLGGSGSTLIAREQTNLVNCTMEFDPKYVEKLRHHLTICHISFWFGILLIVFFTL